MLIAIHALVIALLSRELFSQLLPNLRRLLLSLLSLLLNRSLVQVILEHIWFLLIL